MPRQRKPTEAQQDAILAMIRADIACGRWRQGAAMIGIWPAGDGLRIGTVERSECFSWARLDAMYPEHGPDRPWRPSLIRRRSDPPWLRRKVYLREVAAA